jgi:ribosomal protein S18 acetylase RimI-like enzyme
MAITYYKRFRMEVDLDRFTRPASLPAPFLWVPWEERRLDDHAAVKYLCFQDQLDSVIFPCLGDRQGCLRLMQEIRKKPGFLPESTWLIEGPDGLCGTIQGVIDRGPIGAIQNVGVIPPARNQGLGRALMEQALHGFRRMGLERAYLEVTAENAHAVNLYRHLGFRGSRVLYKAVDA